MNKAVFKPSFWKIFEMWLIIVLVIMVVVTIGERPDLKDPLALGTIIIFVVVRSLILALVFYLIPYFRIDVNDTHIVGPGSPLGPGWNRVRIPLAGLEDRNVKAGIPWLGFHRITSADSGTITVWWFGAAELRRLLDAIAARRAARA